MNIEKNRRTDITDIKEFLVNTQYLKQIVKDVKEKSDMDSNIYYELVLGKMKYEKVLKVCEDTQIAEECKDMIASIESITEGFTQNELSDILSKETKDIQKYDKIKYYNIKDTVFNGGIRKPYEVITNGKCLSCYIKNRIVSIMLICFMTVIFMLSGEIRDTIDSVVNNYCLENLTTVVIRFVCMMVLCAESIVVTLDILYICIPLFRFMVEEEGSGLKGFISTAAQDVVKLDNACGKTVIYKSINNKNRIKRNAEMLEYLMTKNPELDELVKLNKEIADCKNTKLLYNRMAKVEFVIDELFKQGKLKTK